MKKDPQKKINLTCIDFLDFKRRGLSTEKISAMLGISIETVRRMIQHQEQYKDISGVY